MSTAAGRAGATLVATRRRMRRRLQPRVARLAAGAAVAVSGALALAARASVRPDMAGITVVLGVGATVAVVATVLVRPSLLVGALGLHGLLFVLALVSQPDPWLGATAWAGVLVLLAELVAWADDAGSPAPRSAAVERRRGAQVATTTLGAVAVAALVLVVATLPAPSSRSWWPLVLGLGAIVLIAALVAVSRPDGPGGLRDVDEARSPDRQFR